MTLGPVLQAALQAQAACDASGLPNCVIGGVALQRWGEPRFTADADLSVLVEPGGEQAAVDALLSRLAPRIDDPHGFALRTRVVLARSAEGVGLDIVLAGLPYEARVIARASSWDLDGSVTLRTCSAEDLVVMKVFAARDKDWADVTGIIERQGSKLDLDLIRTELRPLLEAREAPELLEQLEARIRRHLRHLP
jgi:hypothetical protein